MALPSQTGVRSGGRQMMFRRKRHKLPPGLIPVLAVLVVAGVGYLAWRQLGGPARAGASDGSPQQTTADAGDERSIEELIGGTSPRAEVLGISDRRTEIQVPSRRDASGSLMGAIDRSASLARNSTTTAAPSETRSMTTPSEVVATPEARHESAGVSPHTQVQGSGTLATLVRLAQKRLDENKPVEARGLFNRALARAAGSDAAAIRRRLSELNDELLFSPRIYPDDPLAFSYTIQGGDVLSKIVRRQDLAVDWRLIQWVNRLSSPSRIRAGQKIKLVRGPFHAIVNKADFRLDLYWGPPEEREEWVFIRSVPVGLGEGNSTPIGLFRVRSDGRLVNPGWANPRTGEQFDRNDPKNPIGEFWIGIEGLGDSAVHEGYGLHGTIDPDSIGRQVSMGCVRLRDQDIELVYSLLADGLSLVEIVP